MRSSRYPTIACALAAAGLSLATTAASAQDLIVVQLSPGQGMEEALVEQIAHAKANKLIPVVELESPECPPCSALLGSKDDGLMKDAFASVYLIRLNIHDWRGQLQPLGFDGRIQPKFYVLGDDARPDGRTIDGSAWGKDTPENIAPPLKAFFAGLR